MKVVGKATPTLGGGLLSASNATENIGDYFGLGSFLQSGGTHAIGTLYVGYYYGTGNSIA